MHPELYPTPTQVGISPSSLDFAISLRQITAVIVSLADAAANQKSQKSKKCSGTNELGKGNKYSFNMSPLP